MARWAQDASERRESGCSPGQRQDHGQADAARRCRAGAGVRQSRCPFSAPNFGKGNNLGRGLSDGEENPKHSLELALWEMGGSHATVRPCRGRGGPCSKHLSEQRGEDSNVGAGSGVGRLWTGAWPSSSSPRSTTGEDNVKGVSAGQASGRPGTAPGCRADFEPASDWIWT